MILRSLCVAAMSSSINDDIHDAFHFYDNKGDKKIAVNQIGNCLRSLGLAPTEAIIEQMCKPWKNDKEARVSVEEFTPIYHNVKKQMGPEPTFEQFTNCLSHFDREHNGTVTLQDLRHCLTASGEKLSEDEARRVLQGIEVPEGRISIQYFVRHITNS